MNKRSEHLFNLGDIFCKFFIITISQVFEIVSEKEVVFGLTGRAHGDLQKMLKLRVASTSTAFSNIGGDRSARTPDLVGQPI